MIKLRINIKQKQQKVIVDLNPQQQLTVGQFLQRVINICGFVDIQPEQLNLYDEQFVLPHQLPSYCISSQKVYKVQRINNKIMQKKQGKKYKGDIKNSKKINKKNQKMESQSSLISQQIQQVEQPEEYSQKSSSLQSYNNKKTKKIPNKTKQIKTKMNQSRNTKQNKTKQHQQIKNISQNKLKSNGLTKKKKQSDSSSDPSSSETQKQDKEQTTKLNKNNKQPVPNSKTTAKPAPTTINITQHSKVKNKIPQKNNNGVVRQSKNGQNPKQPKRLRLQKYQQQSSISSDKNKKPYQQSSSSQSQFQYQYNNPKKYKQSVQLMLKNMERTREKYRFQILNNNNQQTTSQVQPKEKQQINAMSKQKNVHESVDEQIQVKNKKLEKTNINKSGNNTVSVRAKLNPNYPINTLPKNNENKKASTPNFTQKNKTKPTQQQEKLSVAKEAASEKDKQPKKKNDHLSFKQHQQLKWIPVTKQILTKWKQSQQKIKQSLSKQQNYQASQYQQPILSAKNETRFKIVQLDEEKFVPVNSGWIVGYVHQVKRSGKDIFVKFLSVVKNSRQSDQKNNTQLIKDYEIPFHNMQQIQIDKNTLTYIQKQILGDKKQDTDNKDKKTQNQKPSIEQQSKIKAKQIGKQQNNALQKQADKKNQSLQQFTCGQINYYFSDKNYSTDLFMQLHANSDPNKFINIKLMLNFPKIKKFLHFHQQEKLWSYLTADQKYESRNYQLDFNRKMIKKKNIS